MDFYSFEGIRVHFEKGIKDWKKFYDSIEPHMETLPDPWDEKLNPFQKILLLRCLRPDKVRPILGGGEGVVTAKRLHLKEIILLTA